MAVLFSAVTATAGDQKVNFLVSGIPHKYEDLEGWRIFDHFLDGIDYPTNVSVHAEAYLYGEGAAMKATPEEVAYMMMRIDRHPDFPDTRCRKIDTADFSFLHQPNEICGMEML